MKRSDLTEQHTMICTKISIISFWYLFLFYGKEVESYQRSISLSFSLISFSHSLSHSLLHSIFFMRQSSQNTHSIVIHILLAGWLPPQTCKKAASSLTLSHTHQPASAAAAACCTTRNIFFFASVYSSLPVPKECWGFAPLSLSLPLTHTDGQTAPIPQNFFCHNISGESCSEGRGFESHHRILDGRISAYWMDNFPHVFGFKNSNNVVWKDENKRK